MAKVKSKGQQQETVKKKGKKGDINKKKKRSKKDVDQNSSKCKRLSEELHVERSKQNRKSKRMKKMVDDEVSEPVHESTRTETTTADKKRLKKYNMDESLQFDILGNDKGKLVSEASFRSLFNICKRSSYTPTCLNKVLTYGHADLLRYMIGDFYMQTIGNELMDALIALVKDFQEQVKFSINRIKPLFLNLVSTLSKNRTIRLTVLVPNQVSVILLAILRNFVPKWQIKTTRSAEPISHIIVNIFQHLSHQPFTVDDVPFAFKYFQSHLNHLSSCSDQLETDRLFRGLTWNLMYFTIHLILDIFRSQTIFKEPLCFCFKEEYLNELITGSSDGRATPLLTVPKTRIQVVEDNVTTKNSYSSSPNLTTKCKETLKENGSHSPLSSEVIICNVKKEPKFEEKRKSVETKKHSFAEVDPSRTAKLATLQDYRDAINNDTTLQPLYKTCFSFVFDLNMEILEENEKIKEENLRLKRLLEKGQISC